jgi:integrase
MLTARQIQGLRATGKQYELVDGQVPGLRLRVSQQGTKSFMLLYRHRDAKRRVRLGRFPELGLAEARRIANRLLAEARAGHDPRPATEEKNDALQSVADLAEDFLIKHVQRNNKSGTIEGTTRILRKDIIGPWAERCVGDVTRSDVIKLIDTLVEERSPHAASNVFRAGRTFFNWLATRHVIEASPFEGLKDPAPQTSRERVLLDEELRAIWHATTTLGSPWDSIVRLLILTGRRRAEVVEARWSEFDFDNGIWEIPAARTKGGRSSIKPITPLMGAELQRLEMHGDGLIFPSRSSASGRAVSGFTKMKSRLEDLSGVNDWRLHDIRRTVATNLARLGIPDSTIARILDHRLYGIPDVTGIYNRYQYVPEMREALKTWETHLEGFLTIDGKRPDS